jgi:enoyl-CoA hydratase/carnithine racemase
VGLTLAAAADIRVADETAIFVSEFVDVGLTPDTGASYSVTRGDEPVNPVALK